MRESDPVKHGPALDNLTAALVDVCRSGLPPDRLRDDVLSRLRRAVPFDAAFWATVDPATLLFTRGHQEEIPADTVPYFVRNEYVDDDVNRWTELAHDRAGVRTLAEATAGDMERSPRFRDVFEPLGLGDELRAVFRVGGVCWGCMCLHREIGASFATQEREYVRRLAPHIAEAIRTSLLVTSFELPQIADAPGLVVLGPDAAVVSTTTPESGGWRSSAGRCPRGGSRRRSCGRWRRPSRSPATPSASRLGSGCGRWRAGGRCCTRPSWPRTSRRRSP